MRRILDAPNVNPVSSAYPDGHIRDKNPGTNPATIGTPITEILYGDIIQFFHKLKRLAGITANSLADNETNGFQSIDALESYVNSIGRYYESHTVTGNGSGTDNVTLLVTTKYVNITKNDTDGQSIITVPNVNKSSSFIKIKITNTGNENVLIKSNSGTTIYTAVSNAEEAKTDRIILVADKTTNLWILVDAFWSASDEDVIVGTNGYGYVTPHALSVKLASTGWNNMTLLNGWTTPSIAQYKRDAAGNIHLRGEIDGSSATAPIPGITEICVLDAGYRPDTHDHNFRMMNTDGSANRLFSISDVGVFLTTGYGSETEKFYLDGIVIRKAGD